MVLSNLIHLLDAWQNCTAAIQLMLQDDTVESTKLQKATNKDKYQSPNAVANSK